MKTQLPSQLVTERLLLRAPTLDDAPALNAAVVESFPELNVFMEWAVTPQTLEETRTFCRDGDRGREEGSACPLLMVARSDGQLVGSTGYPRIDWRVPGFEIGYWVRATCQGRGFVTEAAGALARHAFEALGARRVELRMDALNVRSVRVAERLGFQREGTLRHHLRDHHGKLRDTCIYALIDVALLVAPARA